MLVDLVFVMSLVSHFVLHYHELKSFSETMSLYMCLGVQAPKGMSVSMRWAPTWCEALAQ